MKRFFSILPYSLSALLFALAFGFLFPSLAQAEEAGAAIKTGVYVGDIELSGMTKEQAEQAVEVYLNTVKSTPIMLIAGGNQTVPSTIGELGLFWKNADVVDDALQLGTKGNVIERYKAIKDLEHDRKVYKIEYGFNVSKINNVLLEKCVAYDQKAVNATLKREGGVFQVIPGQTGYHLDIERSIDAVYNYLTQEWDGSAGSVALVVDVEEPKGKAEDLAQVRDVLGSFTTSFTSSGKDRSANVTNGCQLIDGTTVYPGEEFSTYEAVSPFTQANGYYMAASYLNGQVVDSLGGGICQVSTTLYNAVLLAELEVTERHNHSMIVTYVDPSADAAIAESSGKDFRFVNNTDAPIYIEGSVENKHITFTIYGKESRSAGHTVSYESEILETIPSAEQINPDAGQPLGYLKVGGSPHTGYKARLWKVVRENGVETSREQINSSSYKMTPRIATVGVATEDPNAYNEIMAAIGTGSIDHVRDVIALLVPPPPADPAVADPAVADPAAADPAAAPAQ